MRQRIIRAQNFLKSSSLAKHLLTGSSITSSDHVIEIGAGQGTITQALSAVGGNVTAYELDPNLATKLQTRFTGTNTKVINSDFLEANLPTQPYKVFSNIPFSLSADIIKKLLFAPNPPTDTYLFLQHETGKKFLGIPFAATNSLMSVILANQFESFLVHQFTPSDFFPAPSVGVGLFRFCLKQEPLEPSPAFNDFVAYVFEHSNPSIKIPLSKISSKESINNFAQKHRINLNNKPTHTSLEDWIKLFTFCSTQKNLNLTKGAFRSILSIGKKVTKIHRTRLDPNWKQSSA